MHRHEFDKDPSIPAYCKAADGAGNPCGLPALNARAHFQPGDARPTAPDYTEPRHGPASVGTAALDTFPAQYRLDAPNESITAAYDMQHHAGRQRDRVLIAMFRAGHHGATCDEIEEALGGSHQSMSARVRELAAAELLRYAVDTSGRKITRPTRSGRPASVYVTSDRGRMEAEQAIVAEQAKTP